MATDVERLVLELSANFRSMEKTLQRAEGSVRGTARRMERSFGGVDRAINRTAALIAGAFGARKVVELADSYTRFTNQLKIAGVEGERLNSVQDDLFAVAQRYGVELESLGTVYSRVSQSAGELGATSADLEKFTTGVAAALKVQGSSAAASRGALLQLSQALGGNIVRAEEFNSIQEGARPILVAVANGSDRFKGSVSALTIAVKDGTVTSKEFFQAFLKGSRDLESQAAKAVLTIGQSFQILNNALGRYLGENEDAKSATELLAKAIRLLAENIETVVPALVVLATFLGSRYVGAALGAAAANGRLALSFAGVGKGILAAFGGPVGAAIFGTTVLVGSLAGALRDSTKPTKDVTLLTDAMQKAVDEYGAAAFDAAKASDKEREALVKLREEKLRQVLVTKKAAEASLISARASLAAAAAAAQQFIYSGSDAQAGAMASGAEGGSYGQGLNLGVRVNRAAANVAAITNQIASLEKQIGEINTAVGGLGSGGGGAGDGKGDRGSKPLDPLEVMGRRADAFWDNEEKRLQGLHDMAEDERQRVGDFANDFWDNEEKRQQGLIDAEQQALDEKAAFQELQNEIDNYLFDRQQGEYDATYTGIRTGLQAVADGDAIDYLKDRLQMAMLDSIATSFTQGFLKLGGGNSGSNPFVSIGKALGLIPQYNVGTRFHPGGLAKVHKDEILNLPRGTQVTPPGMAARMGVKGGDTIILQPLHFHAEGAVLTGEILAQANAMAAQQAGSAVEMSKLRQQRANMASSMSRLGRG